MPTRRFVISALAVAAFALSGCSGDEGPGLQPAPKTPSTSGAGASDETTPPSLSSIVHDEISPEIRTSHFPAADVVKYGNWLSSGFEPTGAETVERRVLPCDDAELVLAVDHQVLDFAETVVEDGDFVISRQMTLYPDPATADWFVKQLERQPMGCDKLMGQSNLAAVERLNYTRDSLFGVKDRSALFSATSLHYGDIRYAFVDIINQQDNAIVFTRIGTLRPPTNGGGGVFINKDKNPEFVKQIRTQGNRARAILNEFSAR